MRGINKWAAMFCLTLMAAAGLIWWWFYRSSTAASHAYAIETNKEIAIMRKQAEVKTPERLAYLASMASKLSAASDAMVMNVEFHGKVVDQFGSPVTGMKVTYEAGGSPYTKGSGIGSVMTEEDGSFVIANVKAYLLNIWEFEKDNYEARGRVSFRGFIQGGGDGIGSWDDYTKEKPYIFHASKIEKYARVKSEKGRLLTFDPSGTIYTVDFTGEDRVKWGGVREGDIRISVSRNDNDWQIKIDGVDGGIQETNEEYMNLAPESGYQETVTYSGGKENSFSVKKKLYFKSRGGKIYGALKLDMRPYAKFDGKDAGIDVDYAINLEGGRELAVKPEE